MKRRNHEIKEIYEKYAMAMVKFGMRSGVNSERAKELMHDAFALLISKHGEIKKRHNNLAGWVIKTNSNLIKREHRAAKLKREFEISFEEWMVASKPDNYRFSLRELIPKGLSEDKETALVLFYEEDLSYKEISARMEISEGYVGALLSRARGELKELYEAEEKRLARGVCFVS